MSRDPCLSEIWPELVFKLVPLFEPLDAAGGIQHPPFTGEKRVAFAAYLDAELLPGGTGGEPVAAGADDLGIGIILGVNFFFHVN
jgi:hypothetical protein